MTTRQKLEWMAERLVATRGVASVYTRAAGTAAERSLNVVAIPVREIEDVNQPQGRIGRTVGREQDFVLAVGSLSLDGQRFEPQEGDRLKATLGGGETPLTFEILARPNLPCWEYSDVHRVLYRLHARELVTSTEGQ